MKPGEVLAVLEKAGELIEVSGKVSDETLALSTRPNTPSFMHASSLRKCCRSAI